MTDARTIAAGLSAEERRILRWFANLPKGVGYRVKETREMQALHERKLIWSPTWLPATAPCWARKMDGVGHRIWRAIDKQPTRWLSRLLYKMPEPGLTPLGREVAAALQEQKG